MYKALKEKVLTNPTNENLVDLANWLQENDPNSWNGEKLYFDGYVLKPEYKQINGDFIINSWELGKE